MKELDATNEFLYEWLLGESNNVWILFYSVTSTYTVT